MNNSIKLGLINCQSFVNKTHTIFEFINSQGIDILALNETYLNSNHEHINLIKDHLLIRNDRTHSRGGGVAIIINKKLNYQVVEKVSNVNEEYIAFTLENSGTPTLIIVAYTHPKSKTSFDFIEKYSTQFNTR